jgi:hypothetical protein
MTDQLEALVAEQMLDVAAGAAEEVVDADDVGALGQEPLAQMRAEEAGAAGDQDALFQMHSGFPGESSRHVKS